MISSFAVMSSCVMIQTQNFLNSKVLNVSSTRSKFHLSGFLGFIASGEVKNNGKIAHLTIALAQTHYSLKRIMLVNIKVAILN